MKAEEHPHFRHERERLADTIHAIEGYIKKNEQPVGHAADDNSAYAARRVAYDLLVKAEDARRDLYFGRVDTSTHRDESHETFYIGRTAFMDLSRSIQIFAWQDTSAAALYYGVVRSNKLGRLRLKRTFEIVRDTLRSIADEFVDGDPDDRAQEDLIDAQYGDTLLHELLGASRSRNLRDIVRTIQARQYEIITAPDDRLLVVQGPPGSGKTEVALHRVSYLLYQASEVRRSGHDILILGPSRLFLDYTSGVLPSLGNYRVPERSFDEWILAALGETIDYEPQHTSLEFLLDDSVAPSQKHMRFRNARNKGSLSMGSLLEDYVAYLYEERRKALGEMRVQLYIPSFSAPIGRREFRISVGLVEATPIDSDRFQDLFARYADIPLNLRRERLEQAALASLQTDITRDLVRRAVAELGSSVWQDWPRIEEKLERTLSAEEKGRIRAALEQTVRDFVESRAESVISSVLHEYFDDWQRQNAAVAYRRLLRTPTLLYELGESLFSIWDLELLHRDAPRAGRPFRFEDLAALHYLKLLLDGPPERLHDHIVVDEVQDLTPLHFKVLLAHARAGSMTILGDLEQGIYAHHGVESWDELLAAAENVLSDVRTIEISYRSTRQIIEYANEMLQRAGTSKEKLVRPYARSGPAPELHPFADPESLARHIIALILSSGEHPNIAVVCKTVAACRRLAAEFESVGFSGFEVIDSADDEYAGGTVLIPTYLTKGLEFDNVIIADADVGTYPPDQLHLRLLYVAVTRAAHALHICWAGLISPLLDPESDGVTIDKAAAAEAATEPQTVREFVDENPEYEPDWCIERLAGADALRLLATGRIDPAVLDVILRPYLADRVEPVGEHAIPIPGPNVANNIREAVYATVDQYGDTVDDALAFTQAAYGLVRNHLRALGLSLPENEASQLPEQVLLLVTLLSALNRGLTLGAGRWTTADRVLEAVTPRRQAVARRFLSTLSDYGLVSESNGLVRINSHWIPGLLVLALGGGETDWDTDLVQDLACPPTTFGWYEHVEEANGAPA